MNTIKVTVIYEGYPHYFVCSSTTIIKDLHDECVSKFAIVGESYFISGRSVKKIFDGVKVWDIKRNRINEVNLSLVPILNQTIYTTAGLNYTPITIKMTHGLKIHFKVLSTCTLSKILLSCSRMYAFNKNTHSFYINGVLIPTEMNNSTIKELEINSATNIEIRE